MQGCPDREAFVGEHTRDLEQRVEDCDGEAHVTDQVPGESLPEKQAEHEHQPQGERQQCRRRSRVPPERYQVEPLKESQSNDGSEHAGRGAIDPPDSRHARPL